MKNTDLFKKRRRLLGDTYSRTLFLIPSGSEMSLSHSVKYRYKPASDFRYLCGLHLSNALLIILGDKSYLLFEKSEDNVWGEDTTLTDDDLLLANDITFEPRKRLEEILLGHLKDFDRIALSFNRDAYAENILLSFVSNNRKRRGRSGHPMAICDSGTLVGTMRHVKDQKEIINLKEAGARSSKVHTHLMQQALIGKTERQISNFMEAGFLQQDMQWTAYETIVGSGTRSTLLHARATDRVVQDGDSLLVDAGGEWMGYCSDITRVLPAGGIFSDRQKQIYQVVLTAQKSALASIRPGTSLQEIDALTKDVLIEGLTRLHLSNSLVRQNIGNLMPHSTSHWMGMDVHDPCPYTDDRGAFIRLIAGMCFTVEPGLYFRSDKLFREYRGIGIRIEDNVLVSDTGNELLSAVPKEVDEIEQLRAKAVGKKLSPI